ncbi:MAG: peptide deformylase [Clostridiales bacterium]|nr:peptide deformylase [Candidatus Crickella merdequi]
MAIRQITVRGEEILAKKCKPVKEITPRIVQLCEDMIDTMYEAEGVGLAAPQVGIMKRLFVAMPYPEEEEPEVYVMINPEILETEGTQESSEGCLSVPGYMGLVDRPLRVKVRYMDIDGNTCEEEFEDFAATVICHENDHLDGILYVDKAKDFMTTEEYTERLRAFQEEQASEE